ncbi:MAG: CHAT domain-containing protein [Saccharothrix sp.]|nr:CHAT domain-containing protein [Saccharothrix sp.]
MILSLEQRMSAYWNSEDRAVLTDPGTLALEDRLYHSFDWLGALGPTIVENARAVVSAYLLATVSWYRVTSTPGWDLRELLDGGGRGASDVTRATVLFRLVNEVLPEHVPEHLRPAFPERRPAYGEGDLHGMVNRSRELLHEHERSGSVEALDDALVLVYYALMLGSDRGSVAVDGNNQLGAILNRKYEHSADGALLDSAKVVLTRAVEAVPEGDPRLPRCLANLGHTLIRSSERTGDDEELLLAVNVLRHAATAAPDDEPGTAAASFTNLCAALTRCFQRFRRGAALDEALYAIVRAVDLTPSDDRDLSNRLSNLGGVLLARRRHLSDASGWDVALHAYRRAAHRATGPNRWAALIGLTSALATGDREEHVAEALEVGRAAVREIAPDRYEHYDAVLAYASALDAAGGRSVERMALLVAAGESVPADHRRRSDVLTTLGDALVERAADGDREQAVSHFLEAANAPATPLLHRALATGRAALCQADLGRHDVATGTFGRSLTLLESALSDGLSADDDERLLASAPLIVNAAAACALDAGRPERAVELLEQGRGLLLAQAVGVEAVPGFDELKGAAAGGPVVMVNVAERRGDALVVRESGVRVVPLPALGLEDLGARVTAYASALQDLVAPDVTARFSARAVVNETLAWLWTAIVEPVLEVVHEQRVWWCPTTLLALFPLHAAGIYGARPVSALDRVVSSYTPTLRALLHTRARPSGVDSPFLVVSMARTPGYPDLPDAEVEAGLLAERFPDHVRLADASATRSSVADALGRHARAHVVCHGVQDLASASAGGLVVHDGVLTVRDVLARRSSPGDVAFLAACVSAQSPLHLPNEVMTFAGALQLSSFRHVVGTVSPVDATATEFAEAFYADDVDPDETAYQVHRVVQVMRERYPLAPILWATYVHFGP